MSKEYLEGFEEALMLERDKPSSRFIAGFNRKDNDVVTQAKNDNQGYVFMTKPMCNLTADNIQLNRRLIWLGEPVASSLACAIKCSLMPNPYHHGVVSSAGGIDTRDVRSSLVDDSMPFVPMVTSSIKSLTGWPDRVTEYFQSDEGIAKEIHAYVDNRPDMFGTFDLTAGFDARDGDFINAFFQSLWEYQSSVATGPMRPFPAMITQRELDYNLRFYVLRLDSSKKYVRKIACTGAAILGADTSGSDFNYSSETTVTQDNNEISLPFKCLGAWYNDPMAIKSFNETLYRYIPEMSTRAGREAGFVKLDEFEKNRYNVGYPHINVDTYELEWWVRVELYNIIVNS